MLPLACTPEQSGQRPVFKQLPSGPYTGFNDGGGKAQFSATGGGAKAPKFQNFPKIIRVWRLCENRELRFLRAWPPAPPVYGPGSHIDCEAKRSLSRHLDFSSLSQYHSFFQHQHPPPYNFQRRHYNWFRYQDCCDTSPRRVRFNQKCRSRREILFGL